jgi:alpha-tubulin suppressor-like RCC1 family protein
VKLTEFLTPIHHDQVHRPFRIIIYRIRKGKKSLFILAEKRLILMWGCRIWNRKTQTQSKLVYSCIPSIICLFLLRVVKHAKTKVNKKKFKVISSFEFSLFLIFDVGFVLFFLVREAERRVICQRSIALAE